MDLLTNSPAETRTFAKKLAARIQPGDVVALIGDLGAGKTTFVQGFCSGLKTTSPATSPTFTLINIYTGKIPVYHIDLYRLDQTEDSLDIGIEEYLPPRDGVCLLEWADKFPGILPEQYIKVTITYESKTARKISIRGIGNQYKILKIG